MKNAKTKKIISSVMALCIILTALAVGSFAYGDTHVAINATNFPDRNFRAVVSAVCDGCLSEEPDGYLSEAEIQSITTLDVTGYLEDVVGENATITDLTGIQYFTSLKSLYCYWLHLEDGLDVSALTNLELLECDDSELTSLDISANTALEELYVEANQLTTLDVSHCPSLLWLFCGNNALETLSLSSNTQLEELHAENNALTALNLSSNTALTNLNCSYNHLKELDLSANTQLENITEDHIGFQTISSVANAYNNTIFIPVAISNMNRIVSTSLDTVSVVDEIEVENLAYNGTSFYTKDLSKLRNGFDYAYNTGLSTAEHMTVHVDAQRNFFLVRFYTDKNMTSLIDQSVVSEGNAATAPDISDPPQCKEFGGWSEDISDIRSDVDTYIVWNDAHRKYISSYADDIVTVGCLNGCNQTWTYQFSKLAGKHTQDNGYVAEVDVNSDGIINGRDLVYLKTGDFRPLCNAGANATTKKVYTYLCNTEGGAVLSGQQESTWTDNNNPEYEMEYIYNSSGKYPAIRGFDYMHDDFSGVNARALAWWNAGGLVTICWHTGPDFCGEWTDATNRTVEDWDAMLTEGTDEYNAMLAGMDKAAAALKELENEGVTVIWRPFHEFDGNWFWWSKGGAEHFKQLWSIMYHRYTDYWHLNNLIWVAGFSDQGTNIANWYPQECDIAGGDSYAGTAQPALYRRVDAVVPESKPLCFHECGPNPTVEELQETSWLWFMTWHSNYLTDNNTPQQLNTLYNSDFIITRDELPDFRS